MSPLVPSLGDYGINDPPLARTHATQSMLDSPGNSRPASFTCSGAKLSQRPHTDDRALSCPGVSLDLGLAPGNVIAGAVDAGCDNGIEVLGPAAAALEVAAAMAAAPPEATEPAQHMQSLNPHILR